MLDGDPAGAFPRGATAAAQASDATAAPGPFRFVATDAALWLAIVAALQVFRGVLVFLFRIEMGPSSGAGLVARCAATGLRFDVQVATAFLVPRVLVTIAGFVRPPGAWSARLRSAYGVCLAAIFAATFAVDVGYFREYHDQFNHWIFGLVFDDRGAIATTIWKSYPVIRLVLLVAALTAGAMWAGRRAGRGVVAAIGPQPSFERGPGRAVAPVLLSVLVFVGLRASLSSRPLQTKDAAVTGDAFLDKLVMNPFSAFWNAVGEYRVATRATGLDLLLPGGDVRSAATAWFGSAVPVTDLDLATKRTARGSGARRPQHVILVVLESYDAWGLRPENAALHATDRLAALGREGIAADAFVSAGDGTMPSLAALMTGLPETGVKVNYQASMRNGVPTGTADTFRRLGYRPRFFYGGYPSWQRLGDFCVEQGFSEVHGGADMSEHLTGNEWGVDDKTLFRYVENQLGDEPTFDMIMTTSYHPPFSVDLAAEGFRTEPIAAELEKRGFSEDETRILGHLWYSDRTIGDFVEAVEANHPDTLVAITGDHWSRRAFSSRPILFGQRAVPFVLHGPSVLRGVARPARIAGSHLDIVPTLVELAAPAGFVYHAFGRNLLDPALPQVGYGNSTVLTPDVILDVPDQGAVEDMNGRPAKDRVPAADLRLAYRRLHALGWWRVMKGKDL